MKIGFSQNDISGIADIFSVADLDILCQPGAECLEICFEPSKLEKLEVLEPFIKQFSYRSIHLPADIFYKKKRETEEILSLAEQFYFKINACAAVIHPDVVEDWSVFGRSPIFWAVENMDDDKNSFRVPDDFENLFSKRNDLKMVLDLSHCRANDPSMGLADEFINRFRNKIIEIHLSAFVTGHDLLYKSGQTNTIDYCRKLDVPVIIESEIKEKQDVLREFNFIKDRLMSTSYGE